MRNPFRRSSSNTGARHSAEDSLAEQRMAELMVAPAHTRRAPYIHKANRFRAALVGLFVLGLISLGVALWLSTGGRSSGASDWSAWSPQESGLAGAQEIADFVAPFYRATPSDQLAVVTAVNLNSPTNPLQVVIPSAASSSSSGSSGGTSLVPLPSGSTIVYNLCGQGSGDCSIGVGTPSSARLLLLRREALELTLYTFKYLSGISTVVSILPPGHTVQGCTGICPKPQSKLQTKPLNLAVAFDKRQLSPFLDRPLRETLPEEVPPTVTQMSSAPEAELVSFITSHGLFQEKTEQGQDGSSVVVLSPMPPQ